MVETKKETTPWGPIGYITYKRTYARPLENSKNTEEWEDTIKRVQEACYTQLYFNKNNSFDVEKIDKLGKYMRELKGTVAGRFLWQLGTETVKRHGLMSLQNCAFVVIDDPVRPFTWAMDALMLGSGVGYSISRKHVYKLPKVKNKLELIRQDNAGADFIIPDTREGWVKMLGKVLKYHFWGDKTTLSYSTHVIRSQGAPIKGFGGVASGPEILVKGLNQINEVINRRHNDMLRPIDCLDIMNIIGSIVVAGNVRRSAQIAIGDHDDVEFLKAKRWDLGTIPNWRAMSNNSVYCNDTTLLSQDFWDTYKQGEPYGLINIDLARKVGRTGEYWNPDPEVEGFNPCAEQSLANFETCCLAEIFLPNITSLDELKDLAKVLYFVCKHSLMLPCHHKETEDIVHKNMRMGIGITGYLQATEEQRSWLDDTYQELAHLDIEYSRYFDCNTSIKLTTVKPSGTLSLLAGVTPGAHPSPAGPYYIRRIRMSSDSPLIEVCKNHGYHVEFVRNFDGSEDRNTSVVSFPCFSGDNTPVAADYSALEQLETIKRLQKEWSDNSVSCTVTYREEELPQIKEYLATNFSENFKTLSFLKYFGHGFDQAPYETITKEEYAIMAAKCRPISHVSFNENDIIAGIDECEGGACPIK